MPQEVINCDLVVVGSGASGLTAAVTAAWLGLDVVVLEKEAQFGGTSAWSGGWLWVPRNPLAVAAGIVEDIDEPLTYLQHELGDRFDELLARLFLEQAPRMVCFLRNHTEVDFIDGNAIPDFHDWNPGAGLGGRSVCAKPIDGRVLGTRIADLRPPLELISPFGMGIASGSDLRNFLQFTQSRKAFVYVAKRMLRHFYENLRFGRGMHLVNGNALIARLLLSADRLGIRLIKNCRADELMLENGAVSGVVAGGKRIHSARGVVLASGGFPHDISRKQQLFAHAPTGREHYSAAPPSNTGDGINLGVSAGAKFVSDLPNAAAWAPVSLVAEDNGASGHFPHLLERAKPGLIMVRKNGQRFCNEANSYHDVMQDLFAATPPGEAVECWMICDHRFQRRYGLGRARPRPFPLRRWLNNGYLKKARSIAELAIACGINEAGLHATVMAVNSHARYGRDPEFGRGSSAYNRVQGDPDHKPNPCVAPIEHGPFYAVKIVAGSLGTFAGLATDHDMQVLDNHAKAIPGLYAIGNDRVSMMAGRYPAGGITLGPGMTFGFIAAHAASGVPLDNNRVE